MPDTETIDRLFLELSQFTKSTTEKEISLTALAHKRHLKIVELEEENEILNTKLIKDNHMIAKLTMERELNEAKAALAMGQLGCDVVYDDLRQERDQLRAELEKVREELSKLKNETPHQP